MRGMVTIPSALAETQRAEGGAWVRNLPSRVADIMDRWSLRLDGPVGHGMAGLVLPVVRPDGPRRRRAGLDPVQRTIAQTLACPTPRTRVSNTGDR